MQGKQLTNGWVKMSVRKIVLSAMVSFCFLFPIAVQAEGWDFEVELYLMGTSIEGDAGVGRVEGAAGI